MAYEVEFTNEFEEWWNTLGEIEQGKVDAAVRMLEDQGPNLPFPWSSGVAASDHSRMRELRIQCQGKLLRVLYAFNPERTAILLVGGDKTGDDRWYETNIPIADRLYDKHLEELKEEAKKAVPKDD